MERQDGGDGKQDGGGVYSAGLKGIEGYTSIYGNNGVRA